MKSESRIGFKTMSSGLANAHNYFDWQLHLIKPYLGKTILECGTGNGILTRQLLQTKAEHITSIDIDIACLDHITKEITDSRLEVKQIDLSDHNWQRQFNNRYFDTAIMFNVLEHLRCDLQAVQQLAFCLKPKGKLLLFVPAFQVLYGGMDKTAGHFRRYHRKAIIQLLRQAGFRKIEAEYVNPLGFFGWFITNKIGKVKDLNASLVNSQISLYDKYLLPLSNTLQPITKYAFGQSIYAIATK